MKMEHDLKDLKKLGNLEVSYSASYISPKAKYFVKIYFD